MPASSLLGEARTRAGLTQRDLAARARTSQARISRIEQGLEDPSYSQLEKLISCCGFELAASVQITALGAGDELAETLADLAKAAELSKFLTGLAIASSREAS